MNLDPRSAYLNTELGVMIRSPELAQQMLDSFDFDKIGGVYRVELKPDGNGLQWLGTGDDASEVLKDEPGASLFMRLRLWLDEHLIPESML
jgi:putative cardiolipin synthase